jgi:hypothetical protein
VIDLSDGQRASRRFTFKSIGASQVTKEVKMTIMAGTRNFLRSAFVGVLAIGAATLMLPGAAEAGPSPHRVSERLDRIAYEVDRVRDIRSLHRKDRKIDRLQSRLHKLDRISDRQRGRRARRNDARIDRLQHRLRRMERRVEARLDRRRDDRRYDRRHDWRYDRSYDRRDRDREWSYRGPVTVYGNYGY